MEDSEITFENQTTKEDDNMGQAQPETPSITSCALAWKVLPHFFEVFA